MATVTIEAVQADDDTDRLVRALRRVVSGNAFRETGRGRWEIQLNDSATEVQAHEAVASQLDELGGPHGWRRRLRLVAPRR
jgi:hypothetical protein